MDQKVLDFLANHQVGSLTTLLIDGSPHAAAVHYSHKEDPCLLFFSTENTSRKCQDLLTGKTGKASAVIGFSEEEWITLQMDGDVKMVTGEKLLDVHNIHYAKHPNSAKYKDDPETIFLAFTPKWWRYTDYNTKPPTIITFQTTDKT